MFDIEVNVRLSERGRKLLKTENYRWVLEIQDPDLGNHPQVHKNQIMDIFKENVMPEGMFEPESFQVSLLRFCVVDGEWLSVEVNLNSSNKTYIPFEAYYEDNANPEFHLRPIKELNYDDYNTELKNGAYTSKSFNNVDKISRYRFSMANLKAINNNAKINFVAMPMGSAAKQQIQYKIEHNKIYRGTQEKLNELSKLMKEYDIIKLKDVIDTIDGILDDEYDSFGL